MDNLMNTKGIIFDFNGVLFWDSHLHEKAWKEYSKKIRGSEFTYAEMQEHMHGRTNKDILEYLFHRQLNAEELQKYTEEKESLYRKMCLAEPEKFILAPGAIEFLDYLKEKDFPITIATASEIGNVSFYFEHLDLAKWFNLDKIVLDDGTFKGKPAPDIYERASTKLNSKPAECLVIEDSISGITSAFNAKIGTIVAIGPKEKHESLVSTQGVEIVISNFYELLDIIRRM